MRKYNCLKVELKQTSKAMGYRAFMILRLLAMVPFNVVPLTTMSIMELVSWGQMSVSPENGHTVKISLQDSTGCMLVKPPSR